MKDKTLYTLRLNDAEVTLKFNIGMLRRLKTILGKDPLTALVGVTSIEALEFAEAVVRAAIVEDKPEQWVIAGFNDLSPVQGTAIILAFQAGISPDTVPEVGDDTQQGEATDV